MYLSKLELQGFKSFADRTTLQFDEGITSVVGPNGCGKSNIIDAVRWVLGAQAPTLLRSDKMENVIFNGTANRRPLGMAEVQLTVENTRNVLPTEYSEVTVGRRLYRSGESEYLLNNVECRLKDIQELFMDTGMGPDAYSVIELKMVDDILSNKGDSRRTLFEEAAGITKYKERRKQALRKLESTQTDLTRVRDITSELETQVDRLETQAEKAGRYQELQKELREIELKVASVRYDRVTERIEELESDREKAEERVEELTAAKNREEAGLEEQRTRLTDREQELARAQQNLNEKTEEIREAESDRRLAEERRSSARRGIERIEREAEEAVEERRRLNEEREELTQKIEEARPELEKARERFETAKKRRREARERMEERRKRLGHLREQEEEKKERRAEIQSRRDRLENRIEMLEDEYDRIEDELAERQEQVEARAERIEELSGELEEAEAREEAARERLTELEAERTDREEELETAREELQELERRAEGLEAERRLLESMVSSYEELGDAVKYLAESSWTSDPLRTVGDVLGCDDEHRQALQAALGSRAECVVVENRDAVRQAIQQLRQEDKGRATFLVLDRIRNGRNGRNGTHGAADAARENGRAPEAPGESVSATRIARPLEQSYAPLVEALLGRRFVLDSLEQAERHADEFGAQFPEARFVARTGEWVDADGTVHGGGAREETSAPAERLGRREQLQTVEKELASTRSTVEEQQEVVQQQKEALETLPIDAQRETVEEAREARSDVANRLEQLRYEHRASTEQRQERADRREEITEELEQFSHERETAADLLEETREELQALKDERREAEAAYEEAEETHRERAETFNEVRLEVVQAENELENLEREREHVDDALTQLERDERQREKERQELESTVSDTSEEMEALSTEIEAGYEDREELQEAVDELEEKVNHIKSDISDRETDLRDIRSRREEAMQCQNEIDQRLTKLETRLEDLTERIEEEYELQVDELDVEIGEAFDPEAAAERVDELKKEIRDLGAVNELALETYEEEKERLEFMRSQQEDLQESEDTLLDTIEEINTKASEQFDETFSQIQEHFADLFTELFGSGTHAELYVDGENPLDDPIRIKARPRGKKPSTLAQLSGGEKALTAIALLFAIYLVKPSPFCILDEVDAPLDDSNVSRFMRLIRRFSDTTQFILVTHNKQTMEAADRLYGVTMQEQGVSTLVGVKFDEALDLVA